MSWEADDGTRWMPRAWSAIGLGRRTTVEGKITAWDAMQKARAELWALVDASDGEIERLAGAFQQLASQSSALLGVASSIAGSIESEAVKSIIPTVRILGSSAIALVEARLQAARGILESASEETKALQQLSKVIKSQSGMTLRIRVLTMMTNVEVGHLGRLGTGFEHLATELSNFSRMLTEDTDDLERHAEARKAAIEATNCALRAELPVLAEELTRIKTSLGDELSKLESDLMKLELIPARFKACVQKVAAQTAGVVAAIQSYDITRQQIEHVQKALEQIAATMRRSGRRRNGDAHERFRDAVGIAIQVSQLRYIQESVASWISQIRSCLEGMLTVSTSELAEMGPKVGECEAAILARLAHIELLQNDSENCSERICRNAGKHTDLLQLIDEQVKKATVARQVLHLLSLNAIVEASRLGTAANAVLEIGNGISDLSLEWGKVTDQSEGTMREISELGKRVGDLAGTFSGPADPKLRESQLQTQQGLKSLRRTSEFAANQACDIDFGLGTMRAMTNSIAQSADALDTSTTRIDRVLDQLETIRLEFEAESAKDHYELDAEEIKGHFSASYSTEAEHEVLNAAIRGAEPPRIEQTLEGNGVELF